MATARLLNLGCGDRYGPDWINIDYVAADPMVLRHDLRQGIPLPDESVETVYHSHVLEHFSKEAGKELLRECFRVLTKHGIIRVVVPDFEQLARLYLKALDESVRGCQVWQRNYDWLMLELCDQAVREHSGGAMAEYLLRAPVPNEQFVLERMGSEGNRLIDSRNGGPSAPTRQRARRFVGRAANALRHPSRLYRRAIESTLHLLLSNEDYHSLKLGRFRRSGEVHLWTYDRYSLAGVLEEVGFVGIRECKAVESAIAGWRGFHLDSEADGTVYKPNSIYMEATKEQDEAGSPHYDCRPTEP